MLFLKNAVFNTVFEIEVWRTSVEAPELIEAVAKAGLAYIRSCRTCQRKRHNQTAPGSSVRFSGDVVP